MTSQHGQHRHRILLKVLAATYAVTTIFGLWPYNVDRSNHQIGYSRFKFIYSILFPASALYCYYSFGVVELVSSKQSKVLQSKTMDLIVDFYSIIIMVSFIILYVGQHFKYGICKTVYLKCVKVMELLKTFSMESGELERCYYKFFMKTIVFDIINILALRYNLSRSSKALAANPYIPFILYIPVMVIRLYENILYGGLLLLHIVFKQINEKLLKIVTMTNSSKFFRKMERYCQLSEELDKLSHLHFMLSELTEAFNAIFDVQLLFWMTVQLSGLIIRGFFQYIGLIHFFDSHAHFDVIIWQNIIDLVISFSTWSELLLTTSLCESLAAEIDIFSTHVLLKQLKITGFGMFNINLRTVYLAVASIFSYFVILVQFELASKRK